jgi:hypothetical protein
MICQIVYAKELDGGLCAVVIRDSGGMLFGGAARVTALTLSVFSDIGPRDHVLRSQSIASEIKIDWVTFGAVENADEWAKQRRWESSAGEIGQTRMLEHKP